MTAVIHINGWPGCGKLTIARALAGKIGAKVIDNHSVINAADALFDRADPANRALRDTVRRAVFEAAHQLPASTPIIFTNALGDGPRDRAVFADYQAFAAARDVPWVSVVLDVDPAENARRLASAGRAQMMKLTDAAKLTALRRTETLLRPAGCIELDVTHLSPDEAADAILEAIGEHHPTVASPSPD